MNLPRHVAIIMDGNGRWAQQRGLPRFAGHKAGLESVKTTVRVAATMGLEVLTLFAFSTENWQRPQAEVSYLLENILIHALENEIESLHHNQIKISFIGDLSRLQPRIVKSMEQAVQLTSHNPGLRLVVALNYGGKWDLQQACQTLIADHLKSDLPAAQVTEAHIAQHLSTADIPDPDLMIRTGGEQRISNFMLWQLAYTELYFTPVYWPDFGEDELRRALDFYKTRERRFGKC